GRLLRLRRVEPELGRTGLEHAVHHRDPFRLPGANQSGRQSRPVHGRKELHMTTRRLLDSEVPVAEAIVRVLEEAGIDLVFAVPGGQTAPLFGALYEPRETIRTLGVREESLAGVMAEVYGRLTGRPGVVIGQGCFLLANALLGTLEAHLGSSPMLLLGDFS